MRYHHPSPSGRPITPVRKARLAIRLCVVIAGLSIAGCAAAPRSVSDDRVDCGGDECNAACELLSSAQKGDPSSELRAGDAYRTGRLACIAEDHESAFHWYRMAARHGQPQAMSRIGDAYRDGRGVQASRADAIRWYRRAMIAGVVTADVKSAYQSLTEQEAGQSAGEDRQPSSAQWTIVVNTRWKDDFSGLDKPLGAAAQAASKLGSSAVIGGAFVLAGDPIRAAIYGGSLAFFGVIEGVKSGRAGTALHRELEASFSPKKLEGLVREALKHKLMASGVRPVPRVLAADPGLSESGEPRPGNTIELVFEKAALANTRRAWQFHPDNKPELILVVQARARILRAGGKQPILDEIIEYKGRRVLNGAEQPFQAEVQHAADHIAKTVLRRLAGVADFADGSVSFQNEQHDAPTTIPDLAGRNERDPRENANRGPK